VTRPPRMSPFAEHMGFDVVERTDGRAVVECLIVDAHANTRGIAHGGVLSALIDMACGAAVAYQPSVGGRGAVTLSLAVSYVHPAQIGDRVRAVGSRCGDGRRIVTCRAEATNQAGVVLATGIATLSAVG
jgi:uncharacterized protein (TIGR00369 family)